MTNTQVPAVVTETPLVTAEEARKQWEEYQELKSTILQDDDYLWFLEYDEEYTDKRGRKRVRVRRRAFSTRAECEREHQRVPGSRIKARMIKSACRKMARFFGFEIPSMGQGQTERIHENDYIISIERGDYYTVTEWLRPATLETVKASATVFLVSKSGRTWMGRGGAHQSEGFAEDFAIAQTAFTRAVNRAVLDFVGWGEETGEETTTAEPLPGQEAREREEQPEPPHSTDEEVDELFGPPPEPTRQEHWNAIKRLLKELPESTPDYVVKWFKERKGLDVARGDLGRREPPEKIPTSALSELRDGLGRYAQRTMEPPAPEDGDQVMANTQTKSELLRLATEKFGWTTHQVVQHLRQQGISWPELTLAQAKELRARWSRGET